MERVCLPSARSVCLPYSRSWVAAAARRLAGSVVRSFARSQLQAATPGVVNCTGTRVKPGGAPIGPQRWRA